VGASRMFHRNRKRLVEIACSHHRHSRRRFHETAACVHHRRLAATNTRSERGRWTNASGNSRTGMESSSTKAGTERARDTAVMAIRMGQGLRTSWFTTNCFADTKSPVRHAQGDHGGAPRPGRTPLVIIARCKLIVLPRLMTGANSSASPAAAMIPRWGVPDLCAT